MAPLRTSDARGLQGHLSRLEHGVIGATGRGVREVGLEAEFGGPKGFEHALELHARQPSLTANGLSKAERV